MAVRVCSVVMVMLAVVGTHVAVSYEAMNEQSISGMLCPDN